MSPGFFIICELDFYKSSKMNKSLRWMGVAAAVATGTLALVACGNKEAEPVKAAESAKATATAPAAGAEKPAGGGQGVPVATQVAVKKPFDVVLEAAGTVAPVSMVDIRPQMSGVIRQVHIKEGQMVQAGQLLFTLDTQLDQANLVKAQAQLLKDQAALADAERQFKRAQDLVAQNFMSRGAADTAQANFESLQAVVHADRAAVDAAKVPVSYGLVRAAASGRLGAVPVFVGSVVKVNDTSLGTIVQVNPVDVAFSVPQDNLPALLERLSKGEVPEVQVMVQHGGKPVAGKLGFVDNVVDAATGTVKVKARVANPQGLLWPGQFVRARLQTQHLEEAVLVPAQALIQNPKGTAVFVVREGKAAVQPVKVLAIQSDMAAVSGLEADEKVIIDGRQNVRPNVPVSEAAAGADKRGEKKP